MSTGELLDFATFYRREFGRIVHAVRPLVGSSAEDIAQEAFVVAGSRWDEVASLELPFAWVRKVALRMAGRHRDREERRPRLETSSVYTRSDDLEVPDLDLVAAIAALPSRHAAAVWLHHLSDRPIAEVARILQCSEGAVKVLLFRARRSLADAAAGLRGQWVTESVWSPDRIAAHLRATSSARHIGPILDEDLDGVGGRWVLSIDTGRYSLHRDDGLRLDEGRCEVNDRTMVITPDLNGGSARFVVGIDADRAAFRVVDSSSPPTRGVPDRIWTDLFYDSSCFVYAGAPRLEL